MGSEIPEWAMEAAMEALKAARPAYDSQGQYDQHWESVARALVAAARRGALAIADMADAYADVSDVKAIHAKGDQENAEYRVEEKTLRQFSAAIRQLGDTP